ncbi:hypothetical protein KY359_00175 [Candidatus Woesearchaeota archaeon]|nr:hypothetical protein [Candidatus Woesearchaeota archaeon]
MGIFNFLKKDKAETLEAGMELPPVPKIEGLGDEEGFPEMPMEDVPPLPDTSLPPLPSEVPGAVPPRPKEQKLQPPKMELPVIPPPETAIAAKQKAGQWRPPAELPELPEIPEEPAEQMEESEEEVTQMPEAPEFPEVPEMPSEEVIPDKIPPLEGLPEPPAFTAEEPRAAPRPMAAARPKPMAPPEMPPAYFAPDAPAMPKREYRGPLFIRTDRFKAILDDIEQIKSTFKTEDDTFFRITDVKNSQDQKYEDFRQSLEDIQRKLLFIDRSLFEAR